MDAPPPGGLGAAPHPGGPMGYYTPPAANGARPAVILWFRVYAIVSALTIVSSVLLWELMTPVCSAAEWLVPLGMGVPFLLFYGTGALVPYKPWGWTYGVVLIAFGLLSCMFPFAVALLVFWVRPEVKAAFQRV